MTPFFKYRNFNIALIVFLCLFALLYGAALLLPRFEAMGLGVPAKAFKIYGLPDFWALVIVAVFLAAAIIRQFNARNNTVRVICVLIFVYYINTAVASFFLFEFSLAVPFALISAAVSLLAFKVSR
ncbi:MAG: hypothetical protein ACOYIQ_00970 [Christensenellales bacterium]